MQQVNAIHSILPQSKSMGNITQLAFDDEDDDVEDEEGIMNTGIGSNDIKCQKTAVRRPGILTSTFLKNNPNAASNTRGRIPQSKSSGNIPQKNKVHFLDDCNEIAEAAANKNEAINKHTLELIKSDLVSLKLNGKPYIFVINS